MDNYEHSGHEPSILKDSTLERNAANNLHACEAIVSNSKNNQLEGQTVNSPRKLAAVPSS